ncbi:MAG: DotA/TraY family protein [Alphaproteobacteria bacterium]
MEYTKKRVLKYTLLPEILPRIGNLFGTGFYHVAFLMAVVFQSANLLPRNHPYLNSTNMGRFGIRHVIAEASRNITWNRRNLDKIIIFLTILTGVVLLVMQIGIILVSIVMQPAFAGPFQDWFYIPSVHYGWTEERDIALMVLDRVFGVGSTADPSLNIFNTCVAQGIPCVNHLTFSIASPTTFPYPIHQALHNLFAMYSVGISFLALIVILYFIVTIIGETAVTGTPFGQRFNRVWAPVRLILFFALIAPLNLGVTGRDGLNLAQIMTLYTAKFGSNFATNAWGIFNTTVTPTYYPTNELVAIPNMPNTAYMAQFWTIVNACVEAEKITNNLDVHPYLVKDGDTASLPWIDPGIGPSFIPGRGGYYQPPPPPPAVPPPVPPGRSSHPDAVNLSTWMDGWQAMQFTNYGDARIVIGIQDPDLYEDYNGAVYPLCGEITIPITNPNELAARAGFIYYWNLNYGYQNVVGSAVPSLTPPAFNADIINLAECYVYRNLTVVTEDCDPFNPYANYRDLISNHVANIQTHQLSADGIQRIVNNAVGFGVITPSHPYFISDDLIQRGWAGAAIWYNTIARINGGLVTAVNAIPQIDKWPLIMEKVKNQQRDHSPTANGAELFNIALPPSEENPVGQLVELPGPQDYEKARTYYELFRTWQENNVTSNPDTAMVQNPILDTINVIFGSDGLFDMRKPPIGGGSVHPGNDNIHPLALLSSLGRSLIEAAVRNLGVSVGGTLGGGLMDILGMGSTAGAVAMKTASSFAGTVAMTIIMIGVMLYYVLPFMPFIYFFFALGGWVKSIFEAMVAMPIWALAHIRIDGDGMPGPGASNGYFLLLEIFVRPILILAGFIGSILIFTAMVKVLNEIFDIMVSNVSGSARDNPDPTKIAFYRGPIDELFFSVMYAAIVYMMALSSFKLIDSIPNNILRWMGVSVSTFQETAGDQVSQMTGSIYQKGNMTVGQISGFTQNNAGMVAAMAR